MQTDDILRTYPEYQDGMNDKAQGLQSKASLYPLIGSNGAFLKKAYMMGYYKKEDVI